MADDQQQTPGPANQPAQNPVQAASPATAPPAVAQAPPLTTQQINKSTISPPIRVAYTRHATAGPDNDLIRAKALVNFWKFMTVAGGIAILWVIISTSYCAGHQGSTSSPGVAVTTTSTPVPISVATPLTPQVVQPMVIQPVVVQSPAMSAPPVVKMGMQSSPLAEPTVQSPLTPRPLTDAERRNEALKASLRRRYGIE